MAWIGPEAAILHYLTVVGADRGADRRFIISGEQVIVGLDPAEIVVPDGTVYFVDGRPKNLASGLSVTSQGVGVKLYGNPMATAKEMKKAVERWLKSKDLGSKEIEFWTAQKFNESETGQQHIKSWGPEYALEDGFVVVAEGTRFAHALAYGDSAGDKEIYQGWEKLLKDDGWGWRPMAVWAIYVYPTATELRGNPARELRFNLRRQQNPVLKGQREKTRKATKRFEKKLTTALKNEVWSMSIRDAMPKYSVVVYVEDCPGRGDFNRCANEVLAAFDASGLDKHLYFDGTDYGPMPGPAATPQSIREMGCPERGYHFYDAGKDHPPGIHTNDPGFRQAAEWERATISQAADRNPAAEKHREAFCDYAHSADAHLQAGIDLLKKGDRRSAARALRHAECDVRQAYTEAMYGKKDSKDLEEMTSHVERLHDRLQAHVARLEASP